jgi:quercetin dioxygenase-like cupin family protein
MKALHLLSGAVLASLMAAGPAAATPGTGVEVETLSKNTVDGTDYIVNRITIAPGGGTGWHYHPGEVFGFIAGGTLTHYDGGCVIDAVYDAGAPIKEGVGPGFVHDGRNQGSETLVMEIVYVNPVGTPLSVEVPAPPDCPIP